MLCIFHIEKTIISYLPAYSPVSAFNVDVKKTEFVKMAQFQGEIRELKKMKIKKNLDITLSINLLTSDCFQMQTITI